MATMNYFKKNARMIMHVYHSSYFHEAQSYFDNLSEKLLYNVVEECVENMEVKLPHKDQMFIVHFYRHVFNGLILDWISEGMEEDPELILRKLLLMISGSIPRSITAFLEGEIQD